MRGDESMHKKHGELKIMTAKEMVDLFFSKHIGMDFAILDLDNDVLDKVPFKYLNIEAVYADIVEWNGIRVIESPFCQTDDIVVYGQYGFSNVVSLHVRWANADEIEWNETRDMFMNSLSIYCVPRYLHEDDLVIVELHDEAYKRAEEDRKCEQILAEQKRKMVR